MFEKQPAFASIASMTSAEIRSRFLAFFAKRGHAIIPSASLVTPDERGITNPTLFNTAGMQPLVPYLLGKEHPAGTRLADAQKCIRTVDIDDIGDKTHATFFEMLGNWSLGDYFKKEAITWSYEFLTSKEEGLGLDPRRLYVTVFEGDASAPRDDEAAAIWREVFATHGIDAGGDTTKGDKGRIFYLPAKNNWWEAGDNGPCGPDTEMFYDVGNTFTGKLLSHAEYTKADKERTVVEIWNDVFMQYEKKDGIIIGKLPKPSVDTGAGLERLSMVLQGVDNIFDTDLFVPIMSLMTTDAPVAERRIVADHIRAASFLIADGVLPSNTDRGYILRRLIRRGIIKMQGRTLSKEQVEKFTGAIIGIYKDSYPELQQKTQLIQKVLNEESSKFAEALINGMKEFEKVTRTSINGSAFTDLSPDTAFNLFSTHGLPFEIIKEIAAEKGLAVDEMAFGRKLEDHQKLSRAGAEQKFKGGLADANDPMVVRYHTATHLLHQALHDVLGENEGNQKGSNITAERLRFDFAGTKLTDEQKKRVEDIVNEKIAAKLPMNNIVLPRAEAEKTGARHFFGEKYGDEISIYFIGDTLESAYSKEFCGGPHVKNTSELAGPNGTWRFKIQKEEASSQGVRRIKAVLA